MQIVLFGMFRNFMHPILLALQCNRKLTNSITLTAYSLVTNSQKYIFNVHQITTFGAKFNIFFWPGHGQKMLLRIYQNTSFQVKKTVFLGRGLTPFRSSLSGEGYPVHTTHPLLHFPNLFFRWGGVAPTHNPPSPPHKPSVSAPASPEFQPDLRRWRFRQEAPETK